MVPAEVLLRLLNMTHPDLPPEVSVIIPTKNRKDSLIRCIDSLLNSSERTLEIIVVDDSTDGTHEYITGKYQSITNILVIHNEPPKGLVPSLNIGIAASVGRYVSPLNDDVEVTGGWDTHLILLMESDPSCGSAIPLILEPDGTIQSMGVIEGVRSRKYPELPPVYGDRGWNARGRTPGRCVESQRVRECEYGCFVMLPREIIEQVGGFDERYSYYCIDPDLGLRIRLAGYKNLYCPGSIIVHHRLSRENWSKTNERFKRDQRVFFEKWQAYVQRS